MYVKTQNGQILKYPYGYLELQAENPYTNFNGADVYPAFQGTEANKAGAILEVVTLDPAPTYDPTTHNAICSTTPILRNGAWVLEWTVTTLSAEQQAALTANQAASVRQQRNAKLTACDWTQVADAPVDKAAWATYRQALRDLPKEAGFPWTMTWPTEPTT